VKSETDMLKVFSKKTKHLLYTVKSQCNFAHFQVWSCYFRPD